MINGRAAGAVSSCSQDMARYLRMFLNNGQLDGVQIVSAETLHYMECQHSTLRASNGLIYGYGLGLSSSLSGSGSNKKLLIGHDGGMMGFSSDLYYSRELGVGFFLSNNGQAGNYRITDLITEFLVNYALSDLPTAKKLNKSEIKPWLGYYKSHCSRNEILKVVDDILGSRTLFIENDTLFSARFLFKKEAFIPVSDFQFRKYSQPIATSILVRDAGKPALFVDENYYEKISPVTYNIHRSIIFGAIFLGAISIILSVVWTILFFLNRLTGKELVGRSIPAFAMLSLIMMLAVFMRNADLKNIYNFASVNVWTVVIFIGSVLFPFLCCWSLYRSVRVWKISGSKVLKAFQVICAACLCYLAVDLALYGWFAIRIWNY